MTLATSDRELTFIYSSESSIGKQALGYVQGSDLKSNTIDINRSGLTGTQWVEVVNLLGANLEDIVAKDHPDVNEFASKASLSEDHWIKFIQNNPNAIQSPILIHGKRAKQLTSPSQVLQFIEVDSAGLEKHPLSHDPETSPNTDGEHQV